MSCSLRVTDCFHYRYRELTDFFFFPEKSYDQIITHRPVRTILETQRPEVICIKWIARKKEKKRKKRHGV